MGLLRRYQAFVVRRLTRRLGEEQARREAPAYANFFAVLCPWTVIVLLGSVAREIGAPGLSLLIYLLAAVIAPFVFIAWRRWNRVRARPEGTTKR